MQAFVFGDTKTPPRRPHRLEGIRQDVEFGCAAAALGRGLALGGNTESFNARPAGMESGNSATAPRRLPDESLTRCHRSKLTSKLRQRIIPS